MNEAKKVPDRPGTGPSAGHRLRAGSSAGDTQRAGASGLETPRPGAATGRPGEVGQHLGGARADFVASLGRKVEAARELLSGVEARPTDPEPREELRRRLHAIASGAKLLRFDVMLRTLTEADTIFERVSKSGSLAAGDVAELAQVLDDLPALAWSEVPKSESIARIAPEPTTGELPPVPARACVLFGSEMLAEALTDDGFDGATFDVERTEHVQAALGLVRSTAPDVVVVDADVHAALELVDALLEDPLTEPVPIVVIGAFHAPEQAARYVALGVAKTMTKPISPESLRATCDEVIGAREGRTVRVSLGEPTVEQLGERLAGEVRQALVECVDHAARTTRVPLGEGTEIIGAIWGAIARVREVVAARTDGAVRFAGQGPEGAIPLAPWLHPEVARGDRAVARARGAAPEVRLSGRRVIVADDDPGVTWFIADLLRTAGCTVYEALDGARALELAWETAPELVVSDILMPSLDGFALCRALKRDVALRATPVVLLSWKEDLLQRVRELGASAAAYLRKESDSRAIVARVREVVRPRSRVEARIRASGEVRGRLDGLTVTSLLELVCAIRPNARVSVRDASYLYEVEIREGAPRRVTRTGGDGTFQRGPTVLTAMLGVGAARFIVGDSEAHVVGELHGTLQDQLAPALAHARGAVHATTGARLMTVDRVLLDEEVVESYLRATPEPARSLIKMLAEGTSPRGVLLAGGAEPSLVEDVLADLAARGAVIGVFGAQGADLLGPAIERARAIMRGSEERPAPVTPKNTPAPPNVRTATPAPPRPATSSSAPPQAVVVSAPAETTPSPPPTATEAVASSLADAVIREISDRSPDPARAQAVSTMRPPIVEPSHLKPRAPSYPPSNEIVPVGEMDDRTDIDQTAYDEPGQDENIAGEKERELAEETVSIPIVVERSQPSSGVGSAPVVSAPKRPKIERSERTPLASVALAGTSPTERSRAGWTYALILAAAVGVVWVALEARSASPPEPTATRVTTRNADPTTAVQNVAQVTFSDATADAGLAAGEGLLELVLGAESPIKIDGTPRGRGPRLHVPLKAGNHELLLGAEDKPRILEVRAGKKTRLEIPDTP